MLCRLDRCRCRSIPSHLAPTKPGTGFSEALNQASPDTAKTAQASQWQCDEYATMKKQSDYLQQSYTRNAAAFATSKRFATAGAWLLLAVALALFALPGIGHAQRAVAASGGTSAVDFRITIPILIKVKPVAQPDQIAIDARHIAQGFIDIDAATAVKLTSNNRDGYLLTANYDTRLLSSVEVRVSHQHFTASSGTGSMRVASGLATDKLVPIGYRLHLAPGVRPGQYRWPVALAFSLAIA